MRGTQSVVRSLHLDLRRGTLFVVILADAPQAVLLAAILVFAYRILTPMQQEVHAIKRKVGALTAEEKAAKKEAKKLEKKTKPKLKSK